MLDVLTGVSPVLVTVYLVARLLIPALLIATLATARCVRGASGRLTR